MKTRLLVFVTILMLINACSAAPLPANNNGDNDCIPPFYDVAFPMISPRDSDFTSRQILPQGNWQDYDVLPFEGHLLGLRPKQHELWFWGQDRKIHRYIASTKQWESFDWNQDISPIFMMRNGTAWSGGKLFPDKRHPEEFRSLLGRFNDSTGEFEYVKSVTGFLQETPQSRSVSNFVEDQSGLVWFFTESDKTTLVSLDVKTGQSRQHYSFETIGVASSITIGQDGSVWFWGDHVKEEIIQYIPSTGETRAYSADPGATPGPLRHRSYYRHSDLYMDRSERLWIGSAWLDFSKSDTPEWYQVIESPVFVSESDSESFVGSPSPNYQSSNGWYWFTRSWGGVIRLDLQKGSWCLMSTGNSEIFEDNDQNLWIAVFGHIYKYDLRAK